MTVEASKSKDREPGLVIVLVRPQLAENVGAAARAMLNFGLTELRLVAPRHRWPDAAAYRAGSGADVVLDAPISGTDVRGLVHQIETKTTSIGI